MEKKRVNGTVRRTVIGRANDLFALHASGDLASLIACGANLTDQVILMTALVEKLKTLTDHYRLQPRIAGGPLLFGRLWEQFRHHAVLGDLWEHRALEFAIERGVFVSTLLFLWIGS